MKTCRDCKRQQPLGEFYVHPQMADGYLNKCKTCVKTRIKNQRDSDVEEHRRRDRKRYYEQPKRQASARRSYINAGPVKHAEYTRRWTLNNPDKKAAHTAVHRAIRNGTLEKQPCEKCGEAKVHAHHEDYSKKLDVMWLCRKCHGLAHRKGA